MPSSAAFPWPEVTQPLVSHHCSSYPLSYLAKEGDRVTHSNFLHGRGVDRVA